MESTMISKPPEITHCSALRRNRAFLTPRRHPRRDSAGCRRCLRAWRRATSSTRTSSSRSAPLNWRCVGGGTVMAMEGGARGGEVLGGCAREGRGVLGVEGGGVAEVEGRWRS
jgi:hypothetical protein